MEEARGTEDALEGRRADWRKEEVISKSSSASSSSPSSKSSSSGGGVGGGERMGLTVRCEEAEDESDRCEREEVDRARWSSSLASALSAWYGATMISVPRGRSVERSSSASSSLSSEVGRTNRPIRTGSVMTTLQALTSPESSLSSLACPFLAGSPPPRPHSDPNERTSPVRMTASGCDASRSMSCDGLVCARV